MPTKKKATAAKLRNWRVTTPRNRAEFLGVVQAADERAAEKAAIEAFALEMIAASGSRCERIEWAARIHLPRCEIESCRWCG